MDIKTFSYTDEILTINIPCSAANALAVLRYVEAFDAQTGATPRPFFSSPAPVITTPQVVEPVQAPAPVQPRIDTDAIARLAASNPVPAPKAEKPKATRKKAEEQEVVQEPAVQEVAPVDPTPATTEIDPVPSSRAPVMIETKIEKPESMTTSDLPQEIIQATRMRDVVVYFLKHGAKTLPEVIEKMRAVQSQIPALASVADLEGRARRTWEVIDMEDL